MSKLSTCLLHTTSLEDRTGHSMKRDMRVTGVLKEVFMGKKNKKTLNIHGWPSTAADVMYDAVSLYRLFVSLTSRGRKKTTASKKMTLKQLHHY